MVRQQQKRSRSQEDKILGSPATVLPVICSHLKEIVALFPGSVDDLDHSRDYPVSKPRRTNVRCRGPKNNAAQQNADRTPNQLCGRYVALSAQLEHTIERVNDD